MSLLIVNCQLGRPRRNPHLSACPPVSVSFLQPYQYAASLALLPGVGSQSGHWATSSSQVQEGAFLLAPHHFSDWSLHQLIPCSWPRSLSHQVGRWFCSFFFFFFWAQCNSAVRWGCLWPPKEIHVIFRSVFLAFVFISWKRILAYLYQAASWKEWDIF